MKKKNAKMDKKTLFLMFLILLDTGAFGLSQSKLKQIKKK